jgi:septal ring factor EnvC (AmiA/AmiB activator)
MHRDPERTTFMIRRRRSPCERELEEVWTEINLLQHQVRKLMSDQSQIDATTAAIEGDVAAINSGVTAVQAEIAALQAAVAAGQPADFTALNQAVSDLADATGGVTAAGAEVPPPAGP